MNRIKTITLTVLLFLFAVNIPCVACWDDDDDDWYDWYDDDDDYAWWIDLPEVEITPDHDDDDSSNSDDDDWWRRDYDEWNSYDDNYDYGDDEEDQDAYTSGSDKDTNLGDISTTEKILKELSDRSPALKRIIEGMKSKGKIITTSNNRTYYDPTTRCIYMGKEPTGDKLLHELIHKIQHDNGTLNYDRSSINNEYEASWLTFLCHYLEYGGMGPEMLLGLSSNDYDIMMSHLEEHVDWGSTVGKPDDDFYSIIDQYTKGHEQHFSDQHKDSGRESYTNSFNPNYNYDWGNNMKKLGY